MNDHPFRMRWQPLSAQEFAVMLSLDLRADTATLPVHRLDRTQAPILATTHQALDPIAGRHTTAHQRWRDSLTQHYAEVASWTFTRWVRVVDVPVPPTMRRELSHLLVHAECGAPIRVVTTAAIAVREPDHPLPDVTAIGPSVVYQVQHDPNGAVSLAQRSVDVRTAAGWQAFIRGLYDGGEDAVAFCRRALDLPPAWQSPRHCVVPGPRAAATHSRIVPSAAPATVALPLRARHQGHDAAHAGAAR
jgi:hypothetical protein